MFRRFVITSSLVVSGLLPGALAADERHPQLAVEWVRNSAEFKALALQAYRAAAVFLPTALADRNFSALPWQTGVTEKPAAIIFDVDETVVSNVEFQAALEPPFRNAKLDAWAAANEATAVPGVAEFAEKAIEAGVELFFVTNRPCEQISGNPDPCPQHAVTVEDIREAGIPADPAHVMLADQQPGWTREKSVRRRHVAETHRVIMLIGDDLGDFIPCTRKRPRAPCTEGATRASRSELTWQYREYWGAGWFVLPNPMHGSWTTVE